MNYYYDLHIHSCLSPCSDNDMTPANLVAMSALAGLDIIALTDHNSCKNCAAAIEAGKSKNICVIPGMELTTSEEIHVLLLFSRLDCANECSDFVYSKLPELNNSPDIFGEQLLFDIQDNRVGSEPRLLASAADIGIYETAALADFYKGVAIPSHIDRPSFSLLSTLGIYDLNLGFKTIELSRNALEDKILAEQPALKNIRVIHNSDAHSLDTIWDAKFTLTLDSVIPADIISSLSKI